MSATAVTLPVLPLFDQARLAVAGFLARYSGPTRTAYTTDLRQYFAWCAAQGLDFFAARRGISRVRHGAQHQVSTRGFASARFPPKAGTFPPTATG